MSVLSGYEVRDATPARPALPTELRRRLHRAMVVGRAFNRQATAFSRQGRLAVYPSSRGQEACQVGSVLAVRPTDWLFPTYRESVALLTRGIDPVEVLSLFRGDRHCGYNPRAEHTAPQCTPLATQCLHAAGLADAARMAGDPVVALAYIGDGATSEGDFHEALNYAAVRRAPVVFLVQNNQYAISVPLAKQTAARTLADKAAGYGMPGVRVDGNDVLEVYHAVREAADRARSGGGPTLVEAVTYRLEAHTNADDDSRYRPEGEAEDWADRDPVVRLEERLLAEGVLDTEAVAEVEAAATAFAAELSARFDESPRRDPMELFQHVYHQLPPHLREQAARLAAELAAAHEEE
ncbi:pyruvate dehydrogenase (acetyl-transferring) E1 component subunit alpha [Streptomyces durbertensis]|uniref:Pyruvate dehydrogenase (Acetyl-transferring) E1 component subunit alpha n=1 Tax=Streptomyces durbertensis TaxID=2448886 RepID=A0ABR6EGP5_9ACTN|nr:pyruvate dehydrogenase (acetyl-transferring) E1 component subunit alpha [Streptomyces durbertensis]MBB1244492.1 pyruvate dehydrogenase (acetyl-transferring) E1 component subunit alpha [Streptomyces durbertensis]